MKTNFNLLRHYFKFFISLLFLLIEFVFGWLITCGSAFYTGRVLFKITTNYALLLGPILMALLVASYWILVIITIPKNLKKHKFG